MADYTDLPDTAVGIGGIPSGTTVTALRDNPIAIAERAVGAPLVVGATNDLLERTVISGTPANVDFTFDATNYTKIVFEIENIIPATDGVRLYIRTSTDGGATFDSGASSYQYAYASSLAGASSLGLSESTGAAQIDATGNLVGSAAGEDGVSGTVSVFSAATTRKTSMQIDLNYWTNGGVIAASNGTGVRNSAADVDAIRFFWASGNFEDGGIITMYGVRNL